MYFIYINKGNKKTFFQDAVTFLKSNNRYECYGFGNGNGANSLVVQTEKNSTTIALQNDEKDNVSYIESKHSLANDCTSSETIIKDKCNNITSETDNSGSIGNVKKLSEIFNETLPSIPEAPHDAETQGTWSAVLTANNLAIPKMSAAALFKEMTEAPASSFINIKSSLTNSKDGFEKEKVDMLNSFDSTKENYNKKMNNKKFFSQKHIDSVQTRSIDQTKC